MCNIYFYLAIFIYKMDLQKTIVDTVLREPSGSNEIVEQVLASQKTSEGKIILSEREVLVKALAILSPNAEMPPVKSRKTEGAETKNHSLYIPISRVSFIDHIRNLSLETILQVCGFNKFKDTEDIVNEIMGMCNKNQEYSIKVALVINAAYSKCAILDKECTQFLYNWDSGIITKEEKDLANNQTHYSLALARLSGSQGHYMCQWPVLSDETIKKLQGYGFVKLIRQFLTWNRDVTPHVVIDVAKDLNMALATKEYLVTKMIKLYDNNRNKLNKNLTHEVVLFSERDTVTTLKTLVNDTNLQDKLHSKPKKQDYLNLLVSHSEN